MNGPTLAHAAAGLAALAGIVLPCPASAADAPTRAALEVLAGRTVFFGHQSVGANILEGIAELARRDGVALRIVEVGRLGARQPPGTFAHANVAENGDPLRKLRSFDEALGPGPADVDVAFVKFCWVDFTKETDATALFAAYRSTLAALRARHPGTTFVHVTVPLTTVQGGWKALVKSFLGREPYGFLENARREEFSELLRQAYRGKEPVFDLARVESTGLDGRPAAFEREGRRVPVLVAAFTDDGGHLNAEGRRRVASALVELLAALPLPPRAPAATR